MILLRMEKWMPKVLFFVIVFYRDMCSVAKIGMEVKKDAVKEALG
ncbi:MAG: hypothetical protein V5804_03390 [Mucilaginibacter sp.]